MKKKAHHKNKTSKREKERDLSSVNISKENQENLETPSLDTQTLSVNKKKKKIKDGTENESAQNSQIEPSIEKVEPRKKKRKKHMKEQPLETAEFNEKLSSCETGGLPLPDKKRKKLKKENQMCATENLDNGAPKLGENKLMIEKDSAKPKKHKKKRKHCESDGESEKISKENGTDNLTPCKKTKCMYESPPDECGEANDTKKKRKKHTKEKQNDTLMIETNGEESAVLKDKKSKKKKKRKEGDTDSVVDKEIFCEGSLIISGGKKLKKKKRKQVNDFESEETFNSEDKDKQTVDSESGTGEKNIISNSDVHKIKKKRKKAKHDEELGSEGVSQNDKTDTGSDAKNKIRSKSVENKEPFISSSEASKTTADSAKASDESPATSHLQSQLATGQWQGDLFNSADRQNKFLRLLGGMKKSSDVDTRKSNKLFKSSGSATKKGLFGSLAVRVGGGNALSVSDAADLNQKLEEDYNRALDFKLNKKRGTGFGFVPDPAEGKKFHIDVNKTNSVKFDD
ncbi:chromosome 16 open reading frame 88 [Elysia marginata]|uniref:Small acidic protein n=1 Tax=Elysia marginata TaxID=1093978 RepID=A0AAV4GPT5_9GAST|nr:chromosome 16 open reading frame 88 [Elysia marginata]